MKTSRFYESARFMVRRLPAVSVEECFALKDQMFLPEVIVHFDNHPSLTANERAESKYP